MASDLAGSLKTTIQPAEIAGGYSFIDIFLGGASFDMSNNLMYYDKFSDITLKSRDFFLGDERSFPFIGDIKNENLKFEKGVQSLNFNSYNEILGPGFQFRVGIDDVSGGFGFFTKYSIYTTMRGVSTTFLEQLKNSFDTDKILQLSDNNINVMYSAWSEYALTSAISFGNIVKIGMNNKLIIGNAIGHLDIENFRMLYNSERIYELDANVNYGYNNGLNEKTNANSFPLSGNVGYAMDLGIILKLGSRDDDLNFKFSTSLIDVGKVVYKNTELLETGYTSYSYHVSDFVINHGFLNNISTAKELDAYLDKYSKKTNQDDYVFYLPARWYTELNAKVVGSGEYGGLYLNLAFQNAILENYNNYFNNITFTPYFEGDGGGFYLPVTYNQYLNDKYNVGFAVALGNRYFNLTLGSNNVVNLMLNSLFSIKATNVYVACRIPILDD